MLTWEPVFWETLPKVSLNQQGKQNLSLRAGFGKHLSPSIGSGLGAGFE
jgi:hypothetical protein